MIENLGLGIGSTGGVVLFLIALRMVFPPEDQHSAQDHTEEEPPLIVPLAVPFLAGPSMMAVLLLLTARFPERKLAWIASLLAAWAATTLILTATPTLGHLLGRRGTEALQRLTGMLLTALAVQMILDGWHLFTSA